MATEWTKYEKSFCDFSQEGLINPGTQIDVTPIIGVDEKSDEHTLYIIGDINQLGGSCDCCSEVKSNDIVIRYRILATEETE